MIELYTWKTPNGYKALLLLEELGLEYRVIPIPLDGTQKSPDFLKINPNGRIPALVDKEENITVFESGAMLIYLAEKVKSKFLPTQARERAEVIQWLMFQMGGIGPMFGQYAHFAIFADEKIPYGIERYKNESQRLMEVVDKKLSGTKYLANNAYSIADMATYPWFRSLKEKSPELLENFTNILAWMEKIEEREATKRAYEASFEE